MNGWIRLQAEKTCFPFIWMERTGKMFVLVTQHPIKFSWGALTGVHVTCTKLDRSQTICVLSLFTSNEDQSSVELNQL